MSKEAPTPKGRKSTGEIDKEVVETINEVESTMVEPNSPVVEETYPKNFFGIIVKSNLELEEAKKTLDKTIKNKMLKGKEFTELETGYKLSLEPKVSVFIPREKKDPKGASETVTVNGYKYTIRKGVRVLIPKSAADILDRHLMSENVLVEKSIENDDEKVRTLQ